MLVPEIEGEAWNTASSLSVMVLFSDSTEKLQLKNGNKTFYVHMEDILAC